MNPCNSKDNHVNWHTVNGNVKDVKDHSQNIVWLLACFFLVQVSWTKTISQIIQNDSQGKKVVRHNLQKWKIKLIFPRNRK